MTTAHRTAPPVCRVAGLLLAAGRGRRAGGPKALRTDLPGGADRSSHGVGAPTILRTDLPGGVTSWVERAVDVLVDGGCDEVTVVVGAEAEAVRDLLAGRDVTVVEAADWADGVAVSLRAGLQSLMIERGPTDLPAASVDCACVHLVDLPDVGPQVVERLLPLASPDALVRASYAGRVGHPVLLGRDHWAPVGDLVAGDRGAGGYLRSHEARLVECSDLATGADVDTRP